MEKEFFHIDLEMLGEERLFPFHIHVYNPMNDTYVAFLYGNSPLTDEIYEFFDLILSKGGMLAISMTQKNTFLQAMGLNESDIPDLQEKEVHQLETLQMERKKDLLAKKKEKGKFDFKSTLTKAAVEDNYLPLIEQARDEAMCMSFKVSPTVSLGIYLADKLLTEDNFTNRIVALSWHLAKGCGMKDDLALGELTVAAYFCHLGYTQMAGKYTHKAYLEFGDKEKKRYQQHPGLAQHLIRKSGVEISERCHRIIYQHHERADGSGFPENKQGAYIEPLSLVLGACAHLLEYTDGRITGTKVPLRSVITNLKNKTLSPGLELEFGDTIYESLIYLLNNQDPVKEEKFQQAA